MRSAPLVALLVIAVSCATPAPEDARGEATAAAEPAPTPTVELGGDPRDDAFVRSCDTSVSGELVANWRDRAVISGPLALFDFGSFSSAGSASGGDPDAIDREYEGQKVLAVVEAGAAVTLAVPEFYQDRLALLYDPASWRHDARYEISHGQTAVTFQACPEEETQFNGGFVIEGRRCAFLDVWMEEAAEPERIIRSFGAGDCAAWGDLLLDPA